MCKGQNLTPNPNTHAPVLTCTPTRSRSHTFPLSHSHSHTRHTRAHHAHARVVYKREGTCGRTCVWENKNTGKCVVGLGAKFLPKHLPVSVHKILTKGGDSIGNRKLDTSEKILLLGILHYVAAIFLMIVKFPPFHVNVYDLYLTEYASNILLADTLIMGTILCTLSLPIKKPQKHQIYP